MCPIPNAVTMYVNLSGNLCFSFAARNKKKYKKNLLPLVAINSFPMKLHLLTPVNTFYSETRGHFTTNN